MMAVTTGTPIDTGFACIRCGLEPNGSIIMRGLDNCPDYGSSDCPITMGHADGEECESCKSDEWYETLRRILSRQ